MAKNYFSNITKLLIFTAISCIQAAAPTATFKNGATSDFSNWASWSTCQPVTDLNQDTYDTILGNDPSLITSITRKFLYSDDEPSCKQGYQIRSKTCFSYQSKPVDFSQVSDWQETDSSLNSHISKHPCLVDERLHVETATNRKATYAWKTLDGNVIKLKHALDKFVASANSPTANQKFTGDLLEIRQCDYPCVAEWTNWGEWSLCRKACNGGWSRRTRGCKSAFVTDCIKKSDEDAAAGILKDLDLTENSDEPCGINQNAIEFYEHKETDYLKLKEEFATQDLTNFGNHYYILDPNTDHSYWMTIDPCNPNNESKYFYGYYRYDDATQDYVFVDKTSAVCVDGDPSAAYSKYTRLEAYNQLLDCKLSNRYTPHPSAIAQTWYNDATKTPKTATDLSDVTNTASRINRFVKKDTLEYRICNWKSCNTDSLQWSPWGSEDTACKESCVPTSYVFTSASTGMKEHDTTAAYKLFYRQCRHKTQPIDDTTTSFVGCPETADGIGDHKKGDCHDENNNNGLPECEYVQGWTDWGACSRTCGGGTRTRTRVCNYNLVQSCKEWKTSNPDYYAANCLDFTDSVVGQIRQNGRIGYDQYDTIFGITGCSAGTSVKETEVCNPEACFHEPMRSFDLGMEFMLYTEEKDLAGALEEVRSHGQLLAYFTEDAVKYLAVQEQNGKIDFGTILWSPIKLQGYEATRHEPLLSYSYQDIQHNDVYEVTGFDELYLNFARVCDESEKINGLCHVMTEAETIDLRSNKKECLSMVIEADYQVDGVVDQVEGLTAINTFLKCDEIHSFLGMRALFHGVGSFQPGQVTNFLFPIASNNNDPTSMPYLFGKMTWEMAQETADFDSRYLVRCSEDDEFSDHLTYLNALTYAKLVNEADNTGFEFWLAEHWNPTTKANLYNGKFQFLAPPESDQKTKCEGYDWTIYENSDPIDNPLSAEDAAKFNQCCLTTISPASQSTGTTIFQLKLEICTNTHYPLVYELDPIRYPDDQLEVNGAYKTVAKYFNRKITTQAKGMRYLARSGAIPLLFYSSETFKDFKDSLFDVYNFHHSSRLIMSDYVDENLECKNVDCTNDAGEKLIDNKFFNREYAYWLGMKIQAGATVNGQFGKFSNVNTGQTGWSDIDLYSWDEQSLNNWDYLKTIWAADGYQNAVDMLSQLVPEDNRSSYLNNLLTPASYENTDFAIDKLKKHTCFFVVFNYKLTGTTVSYTWKLDLTVCDAKRKRNFKRSIGVFPSRKRGDVGLDLETSGVYDSEFIGKTGHKLSYGGKLRGSFNDEYLQLINKNKEYSKLLTQSTEQKIPISEFAPTQKLFEAGFNFDKLDDWSSYPEENLLEESSHWTGFVYDHEHDMFYVTIFGRQIYLTQHELSVYVGADYVDLQIDTTIGDCLVLGRKPLSTDVPGKPTLLLQSKSCFGIKYRMIFDVAYPLTSFGDDADRAKGKVKQQFNLYWTPNLANDMISASWMARAHETEKKSGITKTKSYSDLRFISMFSSQYLLGYIYQQVENNLITPVTDYCIEDLSDTGSTIHTHVKSTRHEFWYNLIFHEEWFCQMSAGSFNCEDNDDTSSSWHKSKRTYPAADIFNDLNDEEKVEFFDQYLGDHSEISALAFILEADKLQLLQDLSPDLPCIITDGTSEIRAFRCDDTSSLPKGFSYLTVRYEWNWRQIRENDRANDGIDFETQFFSRRQVETFLQPNTDKKSRFNIRWDRNRDGTIKHPNRDVACTVGEVEKVGTKAPSFVLKIRRVNCKYQACREDTVASANPDEAAELYTVCWDDLTSAEMAEKVATLKDPKINYGTIAYDITTAFNYLMVVDMPSTSSIQFASKTGKDKASISITTMKSEKSLSEALSTSQSASDEDTSNQLLIATTSDDWTTLSENGLNLESGSTYWYGLKYNTNYRRFEYVDTSSSARRRRRSTTGDSSNIVRTVYGITTEDVTTEEQCVIYSVTGDSTAELTIADCDNDYASLAFGDFETSVVEDSDMYHISTADNVLEYAAANIEYTATEWFATDLYAISYYATSTLDESDYLAATEDNSNAVMIVSMYTTTEKALVENWIQSGYIPLHYGSTVANNFWLGLQYDENLRRFRLMSNYIQDQYVYISGELTIDVTGATYSAAYREYTLTYSSKLCVQMVIENDAATYQMADCSEAGQVLTYRPGTDNFPFNYDYGIAWELYEGVSTLYATDVNEFMDSTFLINPVPETYDEVIAYLDSCIPDSSTCITYDSQTTHVWVVQEAWVKMLIDEYSSGRSSFRTPNGYFWIGIQYIGEHWYYSEQVADTSIAKDERDDVLDLHLLPIEFVADATDYDCMLLHIDHDNQLITILKHDCSSKTITDDSNVEHVIRRISVVDRKYDLPTTQASESCALESQHITAYVTGDPHVHTFDGSVFTFVGTGEYILAKTCDETWNLDQTDPFPQVDVHSQLPEFSVIGEFVSHSGLRVTSG